MRTPLKYLAIAVLFLSLNSTISSQSKKVKMKWGNVPESDLAMTVYDLDSSASAVVLGDIGDMYFFANNEDLLYKRKKHTRIKILSEAGLDQAEQTISFYFANKQERVSNLRAQTIDQDGSIVKLNKDNIFNDRISDSWEQIKLTFPNVRVGSIIEYSYAIESKRFIKPRDWIFQRDIPVRASQVSFDQGNVFEYEVLKQNAPLIQENGNKFTALNIPAIQTEPYISTMDDYVCKIKFQLKSYGLGKNKEPFLSTWNKLAEILYEDKDFGRKIYGKGSAGDVWSLIKSDVDQKSASIEKARYIYDFVTKSVEWNNNYNIYALKLPSTVMTTKLGSSADINILILGLMQKAGLNAHPVLTNPKSQGLVYSIYPFLNQLGHVYGCLIDEDGAQTFFDGTNKFRTFGDLDEEDLSGKGLLVVKNTARWVDVKSTTSKESYVIELALDEDNDLIGNVVAKSSGIGAEIERNNLNDNDANNLLYARLEHFISEPKVENVVLENLDDKNMDLKCSFDLSSEEAVQEVNDLLYIPTNIYSKYNKNPFKLPHRNYPVDFGYPRTESIAYYLTIPDGYEVESLPENYNASTPKKEVSYRFLASETNGKIQVIKRLLIKADYIAAIEYESVKMIFDAVANKSEEVIVLKRTQ